MNARFRFRLIAFLGLFASSAAGFAAVPDIATDPLFISNQAKPNIILVIDDSGSMDSEMLMPTNDGAMWWWNDLNPLPLPLVPLLGYGFTGQDAHDNPSADPKKPYGSLNYNQNGVSSSAWKKYVYLFPNGTGTGNRVYGDSDNDHYAVPPTPEYAYLRSAAYNKAYYDPLVTYTPWPSSYGTTFSNAVPAAAASDPARGGNAIDLTADLTSSTANWTFQLQSGMWGPPLLSGALSGLKSVLSPLCLPLLGCILPNLTDLLNVRPPVLAPLISLPPLLPSQQGTFTYYPATYYVVNKTAGDFKLTTWAFRDLLNPVINLLRTVVALQDKTTGHQATVALNNVQANLNSLDNILFSCDTSKPLNPLAYTLFYIGSLDGALIDLLLPTGVDAIAPDGTCLTKYEIKPGTASYPSGRSYTDEMQNFANWFTYYRKRHLAMRGGILRAFNDISGIRTGLFTFNNRTNPLTMSDFETHKSGFYTTLKDFIGSGGTPTRLALKHAGEQCKTTGASAPITAACQKNFAIVFTDGFATLDNPGVGNVDGGKGVPYQDSYSNTLGDIAMKYYSDNLRPDLTVGQVLMPPACLLPSPDPKLDCNNNLHLNTFAVGLGVSGNIFGVTHNNVADAYATPPVWMEPNIERNRIQVDDLYHAAVNGRGEMLNASTPAEINDKMKSVLTSILSTSSSASAIAANSTRLNTETLVYQARFNSQDWSGQVIAFKLNPDGSLGGQKWNTDTSMASITPSTRKVWTWDGTAGVSFSWANLSATQIAALNKNGSGTVDNLGESRVAWLRGDSSKDQKKAGPFRNHGKILGDIINSDPEFVSAENFGYTTHPEADAGGEGYQEFLNTKESRRKMLYVGANDGMLHGFDADTGAEQFAYVPAGVYASVSKLTDPSYSHRYFVDGSPIAWDACIGPPGSYINTAGVSVSTSCTWRTVLLGSLGAGGQTIYALDITDPTDANFGKPLWEFSHNDLGSLVGSPQVIKLQSGDWAAIFGNGYRSKNCEALLGGSATGNCKAKLFAVNLKTGALLSGFPIDTGVGSATSPNGIVGTTALYDVSTRILGDENDSGTSLGDGIYAGDLQGNLWRFNYKAGWQVAYKSGSTAAPLFTAKDGSGNLQPITAPLEIGDPPVSGQGAMLYFGTGSYFSSTDPANKAVQTFYAIWDQGAKTSSDRTKLQQQTITTETAAFGRNIRLVSNNTVDWTKMQGWYMDLLSPDKIPRGERVVSIALLRFGRVIFNTIIPSSDPCSAGGTSWLMEVDALSGARLGYTVFDLNKDALFNSKDYVSNTPVSGLASTVGITKTPAVVSAGEKEYKVQTGTNLSGANQGLLITTEKGGIGKPRGAWRQLFDSCK
ncbi:MAG: PilC/PilY family type IV pilus protein [Methylococcaceae bacterium]|nr:PilC/PilY family type IV pilus protein [Methylococcaceae bacterium]